MPCRTADLKVDYTHIRALWNEYRAFLHAIDCYDCGGENLETELEGLATEYAPQHGTIFLAYRDDDEEPCGTIAVKHIDASLMELRRLYVRPEHRSLGMGRKLLERGIEEARARKCQKILLDTFRNKYGPHDLYKTLGFNECPPYNDLPVTKILFMEKWL